ncbi:fibrinogen-like YCDxxxxGGGW domain-containing protein [Kineosporia sp. NBRC 101731]|uniref:fibrinogen-like YCDxxxxGGGW domain-containing protein n=1 Tax=Kineosporia sp. NBRC 101731 TaxID=3032199 RepID=UPI0024A23745|nr:fibrinogen-like YCDxxxxGGGW domain-containing protein [Kineosporia sp. NBRC 101731]GLY28696.1 hypothetical protein Kisp02_20610 [Kineosporia sp. NBRC 101731]
MGFRRTISSLVIAGVAATALAFVAVSPAHAVAVPRDGTSSGRAAASCWEIKQNDPASADGTYWLQTPELVAPQQFYCDQTTDGGGWVLIGRGRDGWQWLPNGQGSVANLRNTPTGTGAFAVATLPGDTVQGLLGGTRVDALTDGVRVRRATNTTGTTWQEMRLLARSRADWTWAIGGGVLLNSIRVGTTSYTAANSQSWGTDQNYLRLTTTSLQAHNYRSGFAFGSNISGVNNSTSYLWMYASERAALPFTQVFLRPRLTSPAYTAIGDPGTDGETVRPLLANRTSDDTPWGVTGLATGGAAGEVTEVEDFAFIGDTAYVAGKFRYVKHGADGEQIEQSYLAAFDVDTGEWREDFRPTLDATAWSLAASPDGTKLFVGGEFTNVNGVAQTEGVAALDPDTGAPVAGWRAYAAYEGTDTPNVRSIDVQGDWLYLGGRFNRVAGGTTMDAPLTLRSMARTNLTDGTPDGAWKPHVDGTVFELDASEQGDRVYLVGNFNNVNFSPSPMQGVVSTEDGAANVPGLSPSVVAAGSGTSTYQQTILEVGQDVWQGGSQHILSKYGRDAYNFISGNITRNGGDFQALAEKDGVIYGACHCLNFTYSGTTSYSSPITAATDVNSIRFIGAWDEQTGAFIPQFYVSSLSARNDMGPWALENGPDGCLWFGGDFTAGSYTGTTQQWLGGFGKLCARDTTAPDPPTGLTNGLTPSGVQLAWSASGGSPSGYEVLRDDRVVATVTGTTWTDPDGAGTARYWVRAIDATGNRSASTPVSVVEEPPGPATGDVLYENDFSGATDWPADWATSGSNGSATVADDAGVLTFDDVSGAYVRAQLSGPAAAGDAELLTSFTWQQATAGSFLSVFLRGSGGWQNSYRPKNGYGLQLSPTTGTVYVLKSVNEVSTTLASAANAQTVGTGKQWLRIQAQGSTIRFRIWSDQSPEPNTWNSTVTDSDVTVDGQVFVSLNRSSANSGAKSVVLDDVKLTGFPE